MCNLIDRDGRPMNGSARFYPADGGTLEMRGPVEVVADDARDGDCDTDDFAFECRHGDGPWEPIELPPPPGKIVLIPAGAVVRAVPRDHGFELPARARERGVVLDYGLGPRRP